MRDESEAAERAFQNVSLVKVDESGTVLDEHRGVPSLRRQPQGMSKGKVLAEVGEAGHKRSWDAARTPHWR